MAYFSAQKNNNGYLQSPSKQVLPLFGHQDGFICGCDVIKSERVYDFNSGSRKKKSTQESFAYSRQQNSF